MNAQFPTGAHRPERGALSTGVAAPERWQPCLRRLLDTSQRFDLGPAWWGTSTRFFATVETRLPGTAYAWDGIKRCAKGDSPFFAAQLTLAGWGRFELNDEAPRQLTPGAAFFVTVPSRHRYYLPPDSPGWTFCWVEIHHSYVVERARRQLIRSAPILDVAPDSALVESAGRLVRGTFRKDFRDSFEVELALFEFMLAYERLALQASHPEGERERLLDGVRRRVLAQPGLAFKVATLAAEFGMSRSHFSHFFHARTARTPARFITEVRLREATRLLVETRAPLEQIATACGFTNANHFSKVFRRFHQRSPGAYRRMIA
ncbi:MAG: AraC family transcriptional regulator [Deltaproteobacteria bacterium]